MTTTTTPLDIIILAAGKGTRMRSALPKVLHSLGGSPMLGQVITTVKTLLPRQTYIVVGHEAEQIQQAFPDADWQWVLQTQQQGTGHAVAQVLPHLAKSGRTLILYGDVPLITRTTLENLIRQTPASGIGVLTALVEAPKGLGRILRNEQGQFLEVIEEADTTPEQRLIDEINAGIYVFPNELLHDLLPHLDNNNAQKEFYLPPILTAAQQKGVEIITVSTSAEEEIYGINDRIQLATAERLLQKRIVTDLGRAGATILDPNRLDVRGNLTVEPDVTIDINVIFSGNVMVGSGSVIGANCSLKNVTIGKNVMIKSHCVIEDAIIADHCSVGPFAHIRPGTELHNNAKVGNFVELKKASLGEHSKVNHLSYVGDAEVGAYANIGAGSITCNYDGTNKNITHIGAHAFIGSNSALVAPVTIGEHAVIGAGSVITKDAPPNQLTLTRAEQKSVRRMQKKEK